jgi:hypothetical protein
MLTLPPWLDLVRRFLRGPCDYLRDALDAIAERLREAVARVVAETVARVVGGVVRALLEDDTPCVQAGERYGTDRPADLWDERPGASWPAAGPDLSLPYDEGAADDPRREAAPAAPPPARAAQALALGCRAVAWSLTCQAGRPRMAVALAVGCATAVAAFVGGPLVAAGAALAGTAAALAALAGLTRVVAAALAQTEES